MSDEKLRELGRRWKETGSVEDEAALLLERVRVGELTQERLELASYCGSRAAQAVAGQVVTPDDLEDWVRGLGRWGPEPCQLACLEAGRLSLPVWDHHVADSRPSDAVAAAERLRRGLVTKPEVQAAAEASYGAAEPYYDAWQQEPAPGVGDAGVAACHAAEAVAAEEQSEVENSAASAILEAHNALVLSGRLEEGGPDIRAVVAPRVIEWTLAGS